MKVTPTAIPDVLLLEPRVFGDARGWFIASVIQSLGATNSQRGGGLFQISDSAAATTGTGVLSTGSGDIRSAFTTATTATDMTSSQTFTLSVTLSASSGSLGMRLESATVLVY